jgi:predicted acylesterase/phospholipase RssA
MKYLAIGPGAMGFYALLGALRDTDLSTVEEISGSSAGAILGLFLALGKSVFSILEMTLMLDFETLMQPDLTSLVTKYGLTSLEPVKSLLVKLCGCDPAFKDLPKKLHVACFCLDTGQTEYFSSDTVPDGRVVDFVAMSIAVPFLFECVRYRGKVYVDGGMIESVPMNPFLGHRKEEVRRTRANACLTAAY